MPSRDPAGEREQGQRTGSRWRWLRWGTARQSRAEQPVVEASGEPTVPGQRSAAEQPSKSGATSNLWHTADSGQAEVGGVAGAAGGAGAAGARSVPLELAGPLVSVRPGADERLTAPDTVRPVTMVRVADALRRLDIRYLADEDGNLLAMWERHCLLFALEGPESDILVMRARAFATLPRDWSERAYAALNEWNHDRRFLKTYLGHANERDRLPLFAEMQLPLIAGATDTQLDELADCAAAVSGAWIDWVYEEGCLL